MDEGGIAQQVEDALAIRGADQWRDACLAAEVLAAACRAGDGRRVGGLWLKARAGGVRDVFLDHLKAQLSPDRPFHRLPANTTPAALIGGIDLAATAAKGRLVNQRGILANADGGILLVPMAERLDPSAAAIIADVMDQASAANPAAGAGSGSGRIDARFVTIAIDESAEGEDGLPGALADRLGLRVELDCVSFGQAVVPDIGPDTGQTVAGVVSLDDATISLLSAIGTATGHGSLRVLGHLASVSRVLAAIAGRSSVNQDDALAALRLCLGIRLAPQARDEEQPEDQQQQPDQDQAEPPPPPPPEGSDRPDPPDDSEAPPDISALDALTELLAAVEAGTIDGMPALDVGGRAGRAAGRAGKAGTMRKDARRGRPFAISQSPPFPDARPDIVATLRAAAPWQRIRSQSRAALAVVAAASGTQKATHRPPVLITRDDYRYQRLRHEAPSTAIFMVDASGSTALERLGETKGAIEQLLAKCYVRRDEVALIAFRGTEAQIVLEPTRSLVMAKRRLSGLPGGGPTPLASGLQAGLDMALSVRRRGATPVAVLMTDGSGNIALDGSADRVLAASQLDRIAALWRVQGVRTICIDIGRRPREAVARLAAAMGADHHVLRRADAGRMSDLVNASMEDTRR